CRDEDPLLAAVLNGDATALKAILQTPKRCLTTPDNEDWTILHEAAYSGHAECLNILLADTREVKINYRTLRGETPLLLAVARNKVDRVQCLLEKGANPNSPNKEKETPLATACEGGHVDMVRLLLRYGAEVNNTCIYGWTALHQTVCRDDVEVLRDAARISPANLNGITPLFLAAQGSQLDALRFLVESGADINTAVSDGTTALCEACRSGHEKVVQLLLSQNADPNKPGRERLLPLHIVAQEGHYEYAEYKIVVSMLVPVTSRKLVGLSGISPLHLAAKHNNDDALEILIAAGFDTNSLVSAERSCLYEDRRSTALYFAIANNNVEAATMLLEAGADPNLDTFNPLLVAVRRGCTELVAPLAEHGANVNVRMPNFPTVFPVTVMICNSRLSLLQYLLDNGCDATSCFECEQRGHIPPSQSSCQDILKHSIGLNPSVCRWAGPIIDVLLDYVGNVQLCSRLTEHLDGYEHWVHIKDKATPPCPLMQLCRLRIFEQVGVHRVKDLPTLIRRGNV
ncbi:LOW QUALITY PROTEIN: ankyrin repeat and SOCS box protein 2-like, partial [Osmerus mordax]|uniref:LOW QUALITY PROTEIN: ankyrin repeat and SOCS box protein 2-like n=1 Tax=Osmerus mordax TaxID=8014 RepID=UPI00350F7E70